MIARGAQQLLTEGSPLLVLRARMSECAQAVTLFASPVSLPGRQIAAMSFA